MIRTENVGVQGDVYKKPCTVSMEMAPASGAVSLLNEDAELRMDIEKQKLDTTAGSQIKAQEWCLLANRLSTCNVTT